MLKTQHPTDYLKKERVNSEVIDSLEEEQNIEQVAWQQRSSLKRFKRSDDNPELPENFKIEQAIGGGDCFFDAVAKGLKQLKPNMDFTVKSLREVCKGFAQSQLGNDQSWFKDALANEAEPIDAYIPRIEFTASEVEQTSGIINVLGLTSPIWGRTEIEGRVVCKEYNIKLHVSEKHNVEGKEIWTNQIVDESGSRSIDDVDYNEANTIHIVNKGHLHFEPILNKARVRNTIQQENRQSPFSDSRQSADPTNSRVGSSQHHQIHSRSSDSPDYDDEVTPEEELVNTMKSNDSEEEKLEKIRKLFAKESKPNINSQNKGHENDTPLHIAVRRKELKVIELLIENGADIHITNDRDKSSLDIAKRLNRQDIVQVLEIQPTLIRGQSPVQQVSKPNHMEQNSEQVQQHRKRPGKQGLHGEIYQLKLLMLFLKRGIDSGYSFRLSTEKKEAKKFDDLFFEITKDGKKEYRLLQAKHKEDESKKITFDSLLTESDGDYSLVKYFFSYQDSKKEKLFQKGIIKDVTVCTNIDLNLGDKYELNGASKTVEEIIKKIEDSDSILDVDSEIPAKKAVRYRFHYDTALLLKPKLQDYNLTRLARRLVECLLKSNIIKHQENNDIFKPYHTVLAKEVIDTKSKKFFDGFVDESNTLSEEANRFRKVLKEEMTRQSQGKLSLEKVNVAIAASRVDFNLGNGFGVVKGEGVQNWPEDTSELAKNLIENILSAKPIKHNKDPFRRYHVVLGKEVVDVEKRKFRDEFISGKGISEDAKKFRDALETEGQSQGKLSLEEINEAVDNNRANKNKKVGLTLSSGFGEGDKNNWPNDAISNEDIKDFLDHLVFAVNQPNEQQLGRIIENDISKEFNFAAKDYVYNELFVKMLDWLNGKGEEFISYQDGKSFFDEAKQKLSELELTGLTLEYRSKVEKFGIKFNSNAIQEIGLDNFLTSQNSNEQVFNIITQQSKLSAIKVYQVLQDIYQESYIYMQLDSILHLQGRVTQAFKGSSNLLVIECKTAEKEENIQKLYNQLSSIIQSSNNKKVVFITQEGYLLANKFKSAIGNKYQEKIDEKNSLTDLTIESQDKLLNERQVIFQGEKLSLGTLIDQESKHLIDAEVLSKFINNKKIEVGKALQDLGDVKDYYIDRTFNRQIKIKGSVKGETSKFFVTHNSQDITQPNLQQDQDIVLISDTENDFGELCSKYKERNIHWLKKEGNEFIWQQSHGVLSNLREFVDKESISEYQVKEITGIADKMVIISAEPGMGKSTVLTKLAEKTKKSDPSLWVVRINLNDHTKNLNEVNFGNDKNKAIDFLLDIVDLKTPLEKELFKRSANHQGKIALLFDGFDEISPTYKNKVIELLQILRNTKVEKLLVTTRPHMRSELEDKLSILSYTLKPLSRENQETFLKKFWNKELGFSTINEKRLSDYTEKLLDLLSKSIVDKEVEFTGIPLQIRMLAEAFQDKFKEFHNSNQNKPNLPEKLNLVNLYERFTKKKYDIYCKEKNKDDLTKPGVKRNYEKLYQDFILEHKQLALSTLFSDQDINNLLSETEKEQIRTLKENTIEGEEKTGIVNQIINGRPSFIHRTFAEYFVALWFAGRIQEIEKKKVEDFLRENIFKKENEVLRNFFDRILTKNEQNENKYELHAAVLNNDKNGISESLSNSRTANDIINTVDKGGRTALHLAAAYGYSDIVQVLLEQGADVSIADNIFNWSPLSYADKANKWNTAELLLQNGANGDDMLESIGNASSADEKGETLLHIAAQKGYVEFARTLVEKGKANVNAKNNRDRTPLHFAANMEVFKFLIEKDAEVSAVDKYGDTILHRATKNGNLEIIKYLIDEKGVDVNVANNYGDTLLHFAAKNGHLDTVKYFVDEKGIDCNTKDNNNRTPLHFAAENGHLDTVKYLIDKKGVGVNTADKDNWTSLHLAAKNGHLGTVKYLIDKKADINVVNNYGRTSLHLAAKNGHLDIVTYLIDEKGVDVNIADNYLRTPLHLAAENGHLDTVTYLIDKKGVGVNTADKDKWTSLHLAAKNGHLGTVKYLIGKKACINAVNNYGRTPLHFAAKNGHLDTVTYLIDEKGVDVNIADNYLRTPLHFAAENGHLDTVTYLIDKKGAYFTVADNYGRTPLHLASHIDIVKYFIEEKGVSYSNNIFDAAKNGYLGIVKYLIDEKGIDCNTKDNNDRTPLHWAAGYGKLNVVKYLIDEKGVVINVANRDRYGKTPLHWAVEYGKLNVVKYLIDEKGAGFETITGDNRTPLHLAIAKDKLDVAEYLIEKGANLEVRDSRGNTPLDLAKNQGIRQRLLRKSSCLSSDSSRRKREAKVDGCELSWDDVDKFNEEKEESRDFSKIKINSDKFIDYIRSESMSEDKLAQLIQLADEVQVKGEFQGLVNKLISNQKVISHLNRVGRVSSIAMHGMIGKATLAAFLNSDYQGVAINLGFIAGGQGFAKVAEAASIKGTGLVADGRLLLGRSLKAASPFLARGTSAFVAYDLVNQIKEYKKGNNDALVDIIGDSIYLGVDSAEIGIEVAEAFAVFEGVSSVTGPIGAAIGAVIFVGTDVYLAVKRVDKIDEIVHLTTKEKFIEGLRAFIGIGLESYVEELMEEKEVNNQLVTQGLEYLKQHDNIQRYVFPTGKSVIDSCRTVQYREQCLPTGLNVCYEDGSGNLFTIKKREKCTTKLQTDLDNKVLLDKKRTDIKWSRARPSDSGPGEFLCLPQGSDESVPSNGTYLCENAIGIEYTNNRTESNTLISLGNGDDVVIGFPQDNHIVVLGDGHKNITLGDGNDTFLLEGNNITGAIYGGNGTNTLDLEHFAQNERSVHVGLSKALGHLYYESADEISGVLGIHEINDVLLRKDKQDKVYTACDTRYVDGRGGRGNNSTDSIIIPYNGNCSYEMKLIVRPYTEIKNYAINGNFTYIVPIAGKGKASVNLIARTSPQSDHRFTFNHTLYDINNIEKINNTVNFSFMQNVGNLRFAQNPINSKHTGDYEFSITNDAPNNALYELNDNTEIKVGERNIYAIQSTNKSVDEIINDYPAIANNLKMSIFVQSLANNETVAVGHGNHDVLHNDPYYKSHLVGNGGENIFVVTSGYEVLDNNDLPIPEVVIYDLDKENLIDTLDLRQMKQQIVKDLGKEVKAKTLINNKDLLIELLCFRENQVEESVVRVRLKDALLTNWYERLHVIVGNVPMKIEEFELKPLPLIFDQSDKNIIVIGSQDIEEENKVVVSKEIGNYTFARSGNNLIITNAFDRNLTSNEFCTISLSEFYQEVKMQTLNIKFADKEIILKDHQKQISTARDIDVVKKEHKDQVYDDVFNHTRSENTNSKVNETIINEKSRHERQNATVHQRSRRAINKKEIPITSSKVSANDDLEFFVAQNNATFVMGNNGISSAATRIGSGINDLFGWVKSSIGGLFNSRAALPGNNTTQSSISQVDAQVSVDGTIMLLDLLIRKVTDQKHIPLAGESVSLLEAQGYALNITTKFEQVLNETAIKSGISATNLNFNPAIVQSAIVEQIRNGKFSKISKTLYSSAEKACPDYKQTDKFLARLKSNLEEVLAEKEVELLVGKQKGLSKGISNNKLVEKSVPQVKEDKPSTFLNGTSIAKGIGNVLEL